MYRERKIEKEREGGEKESLTLRNDFLKVTAS